MHGGERNSCWLLHKSLTLSPGFQSWGRTGDLTDLAGYLPQHDWDWTETLADTDFQEVAREFLIEIWNW